MTLRMSDDWIASSTTRHYAEQIHTDGPQWRVSWLEGRTFSYNAAISALTAAEALERVRVRSTLAPIADDPDQRLARSLLVDELQLSHDEWPPA